MFQLYPAIPSLDRSQVIPQCKMVSLRSCRLCMLLGPHEAVMSSKPADPMSILRASCVVSLKRLKKRKLHQVTTSNLRMLCKRLGKHVCISNCSKLCAKCLLPVPTTPLPRHSASGRSGLLGRRKDCAICAICCLTKTCLEGRTNPGESDCR